MMRAMPAAATAPAPCPRAPAIPVRAVVSPATPGTTTTSRSAALTVVARALEGRGLAGPGAGRRQRPRRPGGRLPGRPRLVRQERQPPAPGRGQLVRARLGGHRRAARRRRTGRCADGCGTCTPLPRRLSRPGPSSRPAWSTPAAAWRGWCRRRARSRASTGWRSATASTAATTARRCARPTVAVDARSVRPPAADEPARRPASTCSSCSAPTDDELLDRHGRWYIPGAQARVPAPQRPGRARQRRRPPTIPRSSPRSPGARATPTRWCAATRSGPPAASVATDLLASGRLADDPDPLVRAELAAARRRGAEPRRGARPPRDAPARHQRLPAQGRRHPVLPVGAVAPARPTTFTVLTTPYDGAAAWDADAAVPGRAHAAQTVLLPTPGAGAPHRRASPTRSAPTLVLLDPALPARPARAAGCDRPYGVVLHGAEVTVPGRLPGTRPLLGRVLRGAAWWSPPAATRRPRPSGPPAAALPTTVVPPGVDTERFRPLDADERGPGAGAASACPPTAAWWSASAGWCPARAWTC